MYAVVEEALFWADLKRQALFARSPDVVASVIAAQPVSAQTTIGYSADWHLAPSHGLYLNRASRPLFRESRVANISEPPLTVFRPIQEQRTARPSSSHPVADFTFLLSMVKAPRPPNGSLPGA